MADFKVKAEAIWAALDEMAEKNPETYKQFINDQLNGDGAKDMLKQLKVGDGLFGSKSGSSSSNTGGGGGGTGIIVPGHGSGSAKLGKSKGDKTADVPDPVQSYRASVQSKKRVRSFLTTSSGLMAAGGNGTGTGNTSSAPSNSNRARRTASATDYSLLDDAFCDSSFLGNPLLAQIVAGDEDDHEFLLTDLNIPEEGCGDGQQSEQQRQSSQNKQDMKKLIEEI